MGSGRAGSVLRGRNIAGKKIAPYFSAPDFFAFIFDGWADRGGRPHFFAGVTTTVTGRAGSVTSVLGFIAAFGSLLNGTWA
jgi:hypothetical protein